MTDNTKKVYEIVAKIPCGKVMTYKSVGKAVGNLNPRVVGNILHQNPDSSTVPCHRVIRSDGKIASNYAFGGENEQREKLKQEGVIFFRGKVNLSHSQFFPK